MKIIVTGSLGYVSTPLIKELIEKGHSVPQSFSRLFKAKTGISPLAFRQRFN